MRAAITEMPYHPSYRTSTRAEILMILLAYLPAASAVRLQQGSVPRLADTRGGEADDNNNDEDASGPAAFL